MPRFKNPKVLIILALVIAGAGVGGVMAFQWIASNTAQTAMNDATVDINAIQLLSMNSTTIELEINGTFGNPTSYDATFSGNDLDVYVIISPSDTFLLGTIDIPPQNVHPGNNVFSIAVSLSVSDDDALNDFTRTFLLENNFTIQVVGSLSIDVEGLLIPASTTVEIQKDILFMGLDGLKNIEIESLRLTNVTDDYFSFDINATVYNPSYLTIEIESLNWSIIYEHSVVGELKAKNIELKHGNNTIYATGTLQVWNLTDGQELASRYLSGENITVTLNGSVSLKTGSMTTSFLSDIQLPVDLTDHPDIQVSVKNMTIYEINSTHMLSTIIISLTNPSIITGNITNLKLDVLYENQLLGVISLSQLPLKHGVNEFTINTTFEPTNVTAISSLATQYLSGNNISVIIRGSETGNSLSVLLHGWEQEVVIPSYNAFSISISKIGLLNSTANSVFLHFDFQIFNPTDAAINLTNFKMQASLATTGDLLGNITIPNLILAPGVNNASLDAELVPENTSLVAGVVNDYLDGTNITLTLAGIASNDSLIGSILGNIKFNVTLPGATPLDIAVISMTILNVSSSNVSLKVLISITNPTASPVSVDTIVFQTNYTNQFLGNVTLDPVTVDPGTHLYSLNVTFTPSNTTLLKDLITNYVNNKPITLLVSGHPNGTDVLSKVLQKYQTTIILPPLDLQLQVLEFQILNTTETTLEIGMNVSLTNPLQNDINLWNVSLNIFYNGLFIGNVSADNMTLSPGSTVVSVVGVLDASENETNISMFVSDYITGKNLLLKVSGSFCTNLSGIIDPTPIPLSLEYTFQAVDEALVKEAKLISISVSISPISFTATATVRVFNPMPFEINVTALSYDIYFDDKDGVRINMILITYTYSPKDHIYIDTIDKNMTNNLLVLPANTTTSMDEQISSTQTELCVRLYDEYVLKNQLYIDVLNGKMTLKIGAFEVQVYFEFHHVKIT